jgi:predicted ribosomally synthesized peptide with nif11-like leader
MSVENVSKFFEMLDEGESLQQEYATISDEAVRKALSDAAIGMASKHGCEFTEEDLAQHVNRLSEELRDEDLEEVAGGIIGDMGTALPGPATFSRNVFQWLRPSRGAIGLVSNNPVPLPSPRWGGDGGEPS